MLELNDPLKVLEIAESAPEARSHLTPQAVKKKTHEVLNEAEKLLQLAYQLSYLEAKLHCDAYHEGKRGFSDLGVSYGYITTFVRKESGTNTMRFAYRRPNGTGAVIRENIRMPINGYTRRSFKRAAHEFELELALMTEESYSRLRRQGKVIKSKLRTLRSLEIFSGVTSDEKAS